MINVLNRLAVVAGLEDNEIEVEEARGLSEENFKALTPNQQIKYIKEHPTSKYGKDPKWLKRAKMLNTKKANLGNKVVKSVKPVKNVKPAKPISKPVSNSNSRYGNYPYVTDPSEIKKLMPISVKYKVNKDGTVDIQGDVGVSNNLIDKNGHFKIKFGKVKGNFNCSHYNKLKSLEGAPEKVAGGFYCDSCENLTSLKGGPEKVGGDFWCNDCNNLTSLEGGPEKVGGDFWCSKCKNLTSLKGAPKEVGRDFSCMGCKNLTSLEGAPEKVGEWFDCCYCKNLKSLKGAPKEISGNFECYRCENLTSLEGAPEKVGGTFKCSRTIKDLAIKKYGAVKVELIKA